MSELNKPAITIREFLDYKEIKLKELEENFDLVNRIDTDMIIHKEGCICCGDKKNQYPLPSEPWTSVIHCIFCDSLLLIVFADRMSGNYTDSVFIYKKRKNE